MSSTLREKESFRCPIIYFLSSAGINSQWEKVVKIVFKPADIKRLHLLETNCIPRLYGDERVVRQHPQLYKEDVKKSVLSKYSYDVCRGMRTYAVILYTLSSHVLNPRQPQPSQVAVLSAPFILWLVLIPHHYYSLHDQELRLQAIHHIPTPTKRMAYFTLFSVVREKK